MRRLVLLLLCPLCACGGRGSVALGAPDAVECAPFARAMTGVQLYGPANAWWGEAAGRYQRTSRPRPGAVLVFTRSARLPSGHVSVVTEVLAPRLVLLTQANWLHGHIGIDQPAQDVSSANDWTRVRVFWPPAGAIGRSVYPAYGFILPSIPPTHASITAAASTYGR